MAASGTSSNPTLPEPPPGDFSTCPTSCHSHDPRPLDAKSYHSALSQHLSRRLETQKTRLQGVNTNKMTDQTAKAEMMRQHIEALAERDKEQMNAWCMEGYRRWMGGVQPGFSLRPSCESGGQQGGPCESGGQQGGPCESPGPYSHDGPSRPLKRQRRYTEGSALEKRRRILRASLVSDGGGGGGGGKMSPLPEEPHVDTSNDEEKQDKVTSDPSLPPPPPPPPTRPCGGHSDFESGRRLFTLNPPPLDRLGMLILRRTRSEAFSARPSSAPSLPVTPGHLHHTSSSTSPHTTTTAPLSIHHPHRVSLTPSTLSAVDAATTMMATASSAGLSSLTGASMGCCPEAD